MPVHGMGAYISPATDLKEEPNMLLYLDEIYWDPAHTEEVHDLFKDVLNGQTGFPEGVTLKAGP